MTTPEQIRRREAAARDAIKKAFGTPADEYGATCFVSHHLEELPRDYWNQHLSTPTPEPHRVLELLRLEKHWGDFDELDYFDFTLPDDVTQYVVCVRFDEVENVSHISMES